MTLVEIARQNSDLGVLQCGVYAGTVFRIDSNQPVRLDGPDQPVPVCTLEWQILHNQYGWFVHDGFLL